MTGLQGNFALAPDALATPISGLTPGLLAGLDFGPATVAWTQRRSRYPSLVVDAESAELLESFREPIGVPQAVLRYSRSHGVEPRRTLIDAYPLLCAAEDRGLLLPESAWLAARILPEKRPGQRIGPYSIIRCLQALSDGEVYQAAGQRRRVALKVARTPEAAQRLLWEARVLARLDGSVTPKLLDRFESASAPVLVLEWRDGSPPTVVADQLRLAGVDGRDRLRRLAVAIAGAYRRLHRQGVIHGDVHPNNLLVGRSGRVTILDFGAARLPQGAAPGPRPFVPYYLEPEAAVALERNAPPPAPTRQGEQYGVATLLFELFTGHPCLDLPLEAGRFTRAIARSEPRSFAARGQPPWPEVEGLLRRSLAKSPGARFASLHVLEERLRRSSARPRAAPARPSISVDLWVRRRLDDLSQSAWRMSHDRRLQVRAAVYSGLAGTALALLRIAQRRNDPALLAAADSCCAHAEWRTRSPGAYAGEGLGRTDPATSLAILHGAAGTALVRGALARARCDRPELARAARWFLQASGVSSTLPELTLGRAGTLLGSALLAAVPELGPAERGRLHALGRKTRRWLVAWGTKNGGPANPRGLKNLGFAHGWAGILFAMLRWCEIEAASPPAELVDWLDQLGRLGEPLGNGLRWPWRDTRAGHAALAGFMPGWCNGSAGMALLWCAAHRQLGRPEDLVRAERAAMDAWTNPAGGWELCCGLTGRAYAALALARSTGRPLWLERARRLADRAFQARGSPGAAGPAQRASLFRGEAGLLLLQAELEQPGQARYPLFEEEL